MFILDNNKMLPEIFLETSNLFEKASQDIVTLKESVLLENKEANVKVFFEKYSKFQEKGLQIFKSSMGDLCVGLKALGNKFGSLGGSSFVLLSDVCNNVIIATGEFISFATSFVLTSEQIMEESTKNVDLFVDLVENYVKYFVSISNLFKQLKDATMHLYGDAKNRLKSNFAEIESSLVNFIHMAKIKIVSAIANACIGMKLGYDCFSGLTNIKVENIFEDNLFDEQGQANNTAIENLLSKFVKFEEALVQATKAYHQE